MSIVAAELSEKEQRMTVQSVTVRLPTGLYDRLKRRAEQAQRSIETEMLATVADALPGNDVLKPELSAAVAQLAVAADAALLQLVRARFPAEKSAQLEALHLRRAVAAWNEAEARQADALATELEEFMFLRAQAMSFLLQRGYDLKTFAAG